MTLPWAAVCAEPEGEYEEMQLKARALLRAVGMCDGGGGEHCPAAAVLDGDEKLEC